jgi:hypothetical protein
MKRMFTTGLAVAMLAGGIGFSGNASAAWPLPSYACTPDIEGETATTVTRTSTHTDYATYGCEDSSWVLYDVTRCFRNTCVPL